MFRIFTSRHRFRLSCRRSWVRCCLAIPTSVLTVFSMLRNILNRLPTPPIYRSLRFAQPKNPNGLLRVHRSPFAKVCPVLLPEVSKSENEHETSPDVVPDATGRKEFALPFRVLRGILGGSSVSEGRVGSRHISPASTSARRLIPLSLSVASLLSLIIFGIVFTLKTPQGEIQIESGAR